jgi:hypothetical protein
LYTSGTPLSQPLTDVVDQILLKPDSGGTRASLLNFYVLIQLDV